MPVGVGVAHAAGVPRLNAQNRPETLIRPLWVMQHVEERKKERKKSLTVREL